MIPLSDLTGQQLGKYELRALIGAGGMGAVYRGYQSDLRRSVAVKVLSFGLSDDANYLERFNREAAVSAALEHAHIVPVYDYGTAGNVTFVVMRLLTGGNLAERIKVRQHQQEALPSLLEIAELLKALASALDYAHSQHVIHRDIKPTNVMFDNQGSPFLVDFGIAKLMEATTGLTEPGQSPGTPVYMAPEQWKAHEIGPATDQYALGIMTYLMMTGRLPFEADTPYQIMHKHFYEMPTPPQAHRADLPEAVTNVLNRVLEKEPSRRFPSVTEFAKTFEHAIAGEKYETTNFFIFKLPPKPDSEPTAVVSRQQTRVSEPRQSQPSQGRNQLVWGGLAVLAAVIIVAVAFLLLTGGEDNDQRNDDNREAAVDEAGTQAALTESANSEIDTPTLDARGAALATNQVEGTINAERTAIFDEYQTATGDVEATISAEQTLTSSEQQTASFEQTVTYFEHQTETATAWTVTPSATATVPTATPIPPTPVPPTDVPTVPPTATLADADYPLQPQRHYLRDAFLHPDCDWQGIGGNISLQGVPGVGLQVHVVALFGEGTLLRATSGTNIRFGPAGWEIQTGDAPSLTRYTVQIFNTDGTQALSPAVEVRFPQNCQENLAVVNFTQVESASAGVIATGIAPTATLTDADYPLQLQSHYLRDAPLHPDCDWQGIGGNISLQGVPGVGLQVHVIALFGEGTLLRATSGTNIRFGPAGWEIQTGDAPSLTRYTVQIFNTDGTQALSPAVEVRFPQNCQDNLAVVNFRQSDSSPTPIATGIAPTATLTDADYPLQAQRQYLRDAFLHPDCDWQGIGGNISLQGVPGVGLQVHVVEVLGEGTLLRATSGTNIRFGPAGWEIQTGDAPSLTRYTVQIFNTDGTQALSPAVEVRFPQNCQENLAVVNFSQVAPLE